MEKKRRKKNKKNNKGERASVARVKEFLNVTVSPLCRKLSNPCWVSSLTLVDKNKECPLNTPFSAVADALRKPRFPFLPRECQQESYPIWVRFVFVPCERRRWRRVFQAFRRDDWAFGRSRLSRCPTDWHPRPKRGYLIWWCLRRAEDPACVHPRPTPTPCANLCKSRDWPTYAAPSKFVGEGGGRGEWKKN